MSFQVIVHGARELEAAFTEVDMTVNPALGKELRLIAKPARNLAQTLAVSDISQMGGSPWSRLKIGSSGTMVYIAERQHRSGGSGRHNLWNLMMGKALIPAVQQREPQIHHDVSASIAKLLKEAGL